MAGKAVIYSDGGAELGASGAGACIVEDENSGERVKLVIYFNPATNNEAEIAAGLLGLALLRLRSEEKKIVHWVSDSEYALKSATSYIFSWQKNGWKTSARKPVKNQGLWKTYLHLSQGMKIVPEHVRGHTGHPENEACDSAATWGRECGAQALKELGEGKIVDSLGSTAGDGWFLIDGTDMLHTLREEKLFGPSQEDCEILPNKLKQLDLV